MSRRIIIVDKDPMTGEIDERFMLEGNYEQLGDVLRQRMSRTTLGIVKIGPSETGGMTVGNNGQRSTGTKIHLHLR